MFSVEQAQQSVLAATEPCPVQDVSLAEAIGRILAQDVTSDVDLPPFDKALVDGLAVRSCDIQSGRGSLAVIAEVMAGSPTWPADRPIGAGQAVRIMTGAPMPTDADAVVMIERTSPSADGRMAVDDPPFRPGQNIMPRGTEMTAGQTVLQAGTLLRPAEIGVLAAVGRGVAPVIARPRVALISTGNELVEFDCRPASGQIRNSNGPVLSALISRTGGEAHYLGIAGDTLDELERRVQRGLEADMLVLSGGVSAGDLDLVPGVLKRLGVSQVFHKVNVKPGKPVWFGTSGRRLVFGLPGNPVSAIVCFELFVAPAIRRLAGHSIPQAIPRKITATLLDDRSVRSDRPAYLPATLDDTADGPAVRLVAWKGSPDLLGLTAANCFAIFPAGERHFRARDRVEVLTY